MFQAIVVESIESVGIYRNLANYEERDRIVVEEAERVERVKRVE